jgi:hypothetical protein
LRGVWQDHLLSFARYRLACENENSSAQFINGVAVSVSPNADSLGGVSNRGILRRY